MSTVSVQLARRSYSEEPPHVTIIDADDAGRVEKYRWFYNSGYAYTRIRGQRVSMQKFLMNRPFSKKVTADHINGDPLDNRKQNLRVCSVMQNLQNKRKYSNGHRFKGVYVAQGRNRTSVYATIRVMGRSINLGAFDTDVEAAFAYDAAAREHFGAFASVNFPDGKAPRNITPIRATAKKEHKGEVQRFNIELPKSVAMSIKALAKQARRCTGPYLSQWIVEKINQPTQKAA